MSGFLHCLLENAPPGLTVLSAPKITTFSWEQRRNVFRRAITQKTYRDAALSSAKVSELCDRTPSIGEAPSTLQTPHAPAGTGPSTSGQAPKYRCSGILAITESRMAAWDTGRAFAPRSHPAVASRPQQAVGVVGGICTGISEFTFGYSMLNVRQFLFSKHNCNNPCSHR